VTPAPLLKHRCQPVWQRPPHKSDPDCTHGHCIFADAMRVTQSEFPLCHAAVL
jgi:hypothetical protein